MTAVLERLVGACLDVGVDPDVVLAHLEDAELTELADDPMGADPEFWRVIARAQAASAAAGRCTCHCCRAQRQSRLEAA